MDADIKSKGVKGYAQPVRAAEKTDLPGLAKNIIARGLLDEASAFTIMRNALREKTSFYRQCIEQSKVPALAVFAIASEELGIPMMELDAVDIGFAPVQLVPRTLIEKHQILPLFVTGRNLFAGVSDPYHREALDEIKFSAGFTIKPIIVDPAKLARMISNLGKMETDTAPGKITDEQRAEEIDLSGEVEHAQKSQGLDIETPIVRFVNKILQDAIRLCASDIHIEPYERVTRIRYRIDGVLHDAISPPSGLARKIAARLKILSSLDIAEHRLPQDGRMKISFTRNRNIDFRVSTMPTLFGEKVVIRILDTAISSLNIDALGMEPGQLDTYRSNIIKPYGMILATGPTGSGKTVTLYSAMNLLNTPERNISSIEDPVEIYVSGINQININEKTGLTFSRALRALLRQDPDVLMVGEIRDLETADIAIKAAQTGHMVLSTLHTRNASDTLTRLLNMGVAPFNLASSVSLIVAQRLVRQLCLSCRVPVAYPEEVLLRAGFDGEQLSSLILYQAAGCDGCTHGYCGRTGIFEVMPVNDGLSDTLIRNASSRDIERQVKKERISSIRRSGLLKAAAGVTTLEEVERVTAS